MAKPALAKAKMANQRCATPRKSGCSALRNFRRNVEFLLVFLAWWVCLGATPSRSGKVPKSEWIPAGRSLEVLSSSL